jgi:tripartite-type tricarboxylate transporter receptor subunit TctC
MRRLLDKLRRRPRESGDPVNTDWRQVLGIAGSALEYWVPRLRKSFGGPSQRSPSKPEGRSRAAFAGTAAERFAALALALTIIFPASAQDLRFKDVNLYVGSGAGGPYDAYARLVSRHLGKHLPGHPSVVVQNMPGASGRRLINFMINVAPKDGSAIATIQRGVPFEPLMGEGQFDVEKIAWIGNANNETNVCIAWHTSPVRSIDDVRMRGMVVGSSGPASTDSIYPNVLNALHGMKFKVVEGYKSATETHVAMERGEVDGRCGISFDTLQALNADWLRDKKVRMLVQIGLDKLPELTGVPSVFDLSVTEEQRQIWALWTAPLKMGRPFFAPPGMPAERVDALRRAFDATMTDPDLRAEAARMNLAVEPSTGEDVMALLRRIYATPKAVVEKAAAASKGR